MFDYNGINLNRRNKEERMRKVILFVIGILLIASLASAEGNPTAINEYTYTINNNTAVSKTTLIDTTIIRPKVDKISAYEITPYPSVVSKTESFIAIYDSDTVAANSELVGEQETASGYGVGKRFLRPRKIINGIWVFQGAYTTAVISFIRE